MSITLWRVLFVVSVAICVIGILVLLFARLLKNKYYHVYTADEMVKKGKLTNGKNTVYFTSGETKNYIDKYAICKTEFDKYLVCKFVRKFSSIRYFVLEYTAHGRVIAVQQIDELETALNSKIITLHKRCAKVNVVIGRAEDTEINNDVIRPLSRRRVRVYALIKSFTLFAFLFAARHFMLELICGSQLVGLYLQDTLNYILIALSFVFALISYFVTVLCLRRRSSRLMNGGAVEYEFV